MNEQPLITTDQYGDKRWRSSKNGALHREDGPAIEFANGEKQWFINGERHRIGGPAIECTTGERYWYVDGECHREDGPAIELANGSKFWCLNDQEYTYNQWKAKCRPFLISFINNSKNKSEPIIYTL